MIKSTDCFYGDHDRCDGWYGHKTTPCECDCHPARFRTIAEAELLIATGQASRDLVEAGTSARRRSFGTLTTRLTGRGVRHPTSWSTTRRRRRATSGA